jgi:hypothetical protein
MDEKQATKEEDLERMPDEKPGRQRADHGPSTHNVYNYAIAS